MDNFQPKLPWSQIKVISILLNNEDLQWYLLQADKKPAKDWPMHGKIRFDRMSLRYGQTNQPVLKNISCTVEAQEKVQHL